MQTTLLTDLTVKEICEGFVYNQLEGKGLFGWSGKLTIQPEYQRNYLYAENEGKKEMAVIDSTATATFQLDGKGNVACPKNYL